MFSAPTNPQRIPVNTLPVSGGLRSCICRCLVRLVTKATSDRHLAHYKLLIMGLQGLENTSVAGKLLAIWDPTMTETGLPIHLV